MVCTMILLVLSIYVLANDPQSIEIHRIEDFIHSALQGNKIAQQIKARCIYSNKFNQYLYISYPKMETGGKESIFKISKLVLQAYAKISTKLPLNVLTIAKLNKNFSIAQSIPIQAFQCFCNLLINVVNITTRYQFNNRNFKINYNIRSINNEQDTLQNDHINDCDMLVFENCLETEQDISLLYGIYSSIKIDRIEPFNRLIIVFALKFENEDEGIRWQNFEIAKQIKQQNQFLNNKLAIDLNLNTSNLNHTKIRIFNECDVSYCDITKSELRKSITEKKIDLLTRSIDYIEALIDLKQEMLHKINSNLMLKTLKKLLKYDISEDLYKFEHIDHNRSYTIIFSIVHKAIIDKFSLNIRKFVSLYYIVNGKAIFLDRYCYIDAISDIYKKDTVKKIIFRSYLIEGKQKLVNINKSFSSFLNLTFRNMSDYLPSKQKFQISQYLHWYKDNSIWVKYTHLKNIIRYEYIDKLTKMLISQNKIIVEITVLHAKLKNIGQQMDCDYSHNLFTILDIIEVFNLNEINEKIFIHFEMVIIAINYKIKTLHTQYLIFPIRNYKALYLISLLAISWDIFLSEIILNENLTDMQRLKTSLRKAVCANIIFIQGYNNLRNFDIEQIIKHIKSQERISMYILIFDKKNYVQKQLYGRKKINLIELIYFEDEQTVYNCKLTKLMLQAYASDKLFIKKLAFYNKLIDCFCKVFVKQYSILAKNKSNMIWYFHGKNSINICNEESCLFQPIDNFFKNLSAY